MKQLFTLIICIFISSSVFSQQTVELGKYPSMQPESKFGSLENVRLMITTNGEYRYYIITENEDIANQARQLGLPATISDLTGLSCLCEGRTTTPTVQQLAKIKNILFGFDSSSLTSTARNQLQSLANIMKNNPAYTVQFKGYTDAKGSSEYNQQLSERRVASATNYLTSRGISSSRIRKEAYGQNNPIAKNTDNDSGRKYNRRVEIQVFDGSGIPLNMVEEIHVPPSLQN